jgi:hypothetical protein
MQLLARTLGRVGSKLTLRRITGAGDADYIDVDCLAWVSRYKPSELVPGSSLQERDLRVIISPDEINAAQWPGPPKYHDRLFISGEEYVVQSVNPGTIEGTLVRFELQARGG